MDINIAKEVTQKKILDELGMISALTADIAKGYKIDSWGAYNEYVKNGQAKKVFEVGDVITIKYTDTAGTERDMDWVVAGFRDKVIDGRTFKDVPVLLMPYASYESVVFGNNEAMYVAPAGGLAAGTYNVHVGTGYLGFVSGMDFQFTLETALAEGAQLFVKGISDTTDPTNMTLQIFDSPNATTATAEIQTSAGTGGTNLGTINSRGRSLTTGLNSIQRMRYGNGNYKESQQRQWANADLVKDTWWEAKNPWQRKHSDASGKNGFMYGLPTDFKAILTPTTVVTCYNTVEATEFGVNSYETEDYFWLPSKEEIYGVANLSGVTEGGILDYMKERTGLDAPSDAACATRIFYAMENHTSASTVRLRSCNRSDGCNAWIVTSSTGQLYTNSGNGSYRAALACQPINPYI